MTSDVKVLQRNDSTRSWMSDVCHIPEYWQSKICHIGKWNQSLILEVWLNALLCMMHSFIWVGRSFFWKMYPLFLHRFPRSTHLCYWNTSPRSYQSSATCVQLTCRSDQDLRSWSTAASKSHGSQCHRHPYMMLSTHCPAGSLHSAAVTATAFPNSSFQNRSDRRSSKGLNLKRTLVSELTQTVEELSWIPLLVWRHKWLQTNLSVSQQTSKAHISLHYAVA